MEFDSVMHWFYVACMAAGALIFYVWSRNPRGVPQYEYLIAMFIPVWSGIAYTAMAFDQGKTEVAGQITHYARYLDWVVTTPLLLLALGLTAMFRMERKDKTLLAALVGADVVMILCGLVADLSSSPIRYVFYWIGVAALGVIFALTWGPLARLAESQGEAIGRTYRKVAGLLTVLWIGYPLGWILGPSGIRLFGQDVDTVWFVLLPILSKVGFSLYDLSELRKMEEKGVRAGHPGSALDVAPAPM